jgi:hypothetical protein
LLRFAPRAAGAASTVVAGYDEIRTPADPAHFATASYKDAPRSHAGQPAIPGIGSLAGALGELVVQLERVGHDHVGAPVVDPAGQRRIEELRVALRADPVALER